MIKYLFFDVYQTLIDVDIHEYNAWDVFEQFLIEKGIPYHEANRISKLYELKETEFYSKYNKKFVHHDWIDSLNDILENYYKINFSKKELDSVIWKYRRKSNSHISLYPGVKEMLSKLSDSYILSIASLAHASVAMLELEYTDIAKFFNNFYFTSQIGYKKSSPLFYEKILTLSGAKANESIMIGDNFEFDVVGGKNAGMYSIWIANPRTHTEDNHEFADKTLSIKNINQLPKVIETLNLNLSSK